MWLMWDASFLRLCETPAAAFFGLIKAKSIFILKLKLVLYTPVAMVENLTPQMFRVQTLVGFS